MISTCRKAGSSAACFACRSSRARISRGRLSATVASSRHASPVAGSANEHFQGCDLFDVQHRAGCSFAFCDVAAVEAEKWLNLARLAGYAGVTIGESEQSEILKQLGVDVSAAASDTYPVTEISG
jgi:hypothetical protein